MFTEDPWLLVPFPDSGDFLENPAWHRWTPEVLRRVGGSSTCAMPRVDDLVPGHPRALMAWGPLLPLLHYHLGWVDVEAGLARWAMTGFDPMDDPTLSVIVEQWGPVLPAFTWWRVFGYYSTGKWASEELAGKLTEARSQAVFFGNDEMHLEGHFNEPEQVPCAPDNGSLAVLNLHGPGSASLVLATYQGWYKVLGKAGMRGLRLSA